MATTYKRKQNIACVRCHALKSKCDGLRPCSRCIKAGKADSCCDREPVGPAKKKARPDAVPVMVTSPAENGTAKALTPMPVPLTVAAFSLSSSAPPAAPSLVAVMAGNVENLIGVLIRAVQSEQ